MEEDSARCAVTQKHDGANVHSHCHIDWQNGVYVYSHRRGDKGTKIRNGVYVLALPWRRPDGAAEGLGGNRQRKIDQIFSSQKRKFRRGFFKNEVPSTRGISGGPSGFGLSPKQFLGNRPKTLAHTCLQKGVFQKIDREFSKSVDRNF